MHISESVRSIVNRDGGIVLDVEQNMMFSLNILGSRIWQRLGAGLSADQIAKEIGIEFGLPIQQAQADVEGFIAVLRAHKLLRTTN